MRAFISRFLCQDTDGATAIEYALIAGSIAVAIAATILLTGGALVGFFESVIALFP